MHSRKKRRLDPYSPNNTVYGEVFEELNLEISMRERLAETIRSRINWALLLQDSLREDSTGATASFKHSAFDALAAIEEPVDVIFARDYTPQARLEQTQKASRPPPRQKHLQSRDSKGAFLYTRSAYLDPPYDINYTQTYLLRCPQCQRTAFTSLQGLLNHARISHHLEWGTHDECVRACAVLDPNIDIKAGYEVGSGQHKILPGLRSLFQMAVGVQRPQEVELWKAESLRLGEPPSHEPSVGTHLTRTLGLHEDTPALAPFLGKQASKRSIKVEDEDVAIDMQGSMAPTLRKPWRMSFGHRSGLEPPTPRIDVSKKTSSVQLVEGVSSSVTASAMGEERGSDVAIHGDMETKNFYSLELSELDKLSNTLPATGSRFHFSARVIVTDRSLSIPLDRRQGSGGFTHNWMISVESASYSLHITTILKRLIVVSLSDSPGSSHTHMATDPPFVVVGTTSKPFLAKVVLEFSGPQSLNTSGTEGSQTIVLEHWVELDLLGLANGAVGEEQVVDIELDKRTVLMPIRSHTSVRAKNLWNITSNQEGARGATAEPTYQSTNGVTQGYKTILTSLLGNFPMTLKDVKGGRAPVPLPYKLVQTPAHLKDLVHGRRKAIEWGRARALQNAYSREIKSRQLTQDDVVILSVGDVFIWLSDKEHFIRPSPEILEGSELGADNVKLGKQINRWCHVCGQGTEAHLRPSSLKKARIGFEGAFQQTQVNDPGLEGIMPVPCNITPVELQPFQIPTRDISTAPNPWTISRRGHSAHLSNPSKEARPTKCYQPAIIVSASHPNLTCAVQSIMLSLKLPTFQPVSRDSFLDRGFPVIFPNEVILRRSEMEERLAPYALLALATKQFLKTLIRGALEVATREKAATSGSIVATPNKKRKFDKGTSILTPVHVLSSVLSRGQGRNHTYSDLDVAILGCLTRLGVPLSRQNHGDWSEEDAILVEGSGHKEGSSVKTEKI